MLDNWLTFLKDPLDSDVLAVKEIKDAYEALKELSYDESVRVTYRKYMEGQRDRVTEINQAVNQAKKKMIKEIGRKDEEIMQIKVHNDQEIANKNQALIQKD